LVSRARIYDHYYWSTPRSPPNPARRKTPSPRIVTGRQGLAGAFNTNLNKAPPASLETKAGRTSTLMVGPQSPRLFPCGRRYPAATGQTAQLEQLFGARIVCPELSPRTAANPKNRIASGRSHRRARRRPAKEGRILASPCSRQQHHGPLHPHLKIRFVYVVFNEFKSVIAQRLVPPPPPPPPSLKSAPSKQICAKTSFANG